MILPLSALPGLGILLAFIAHRGITRLPAAPESRVRFAPYAGPVVIAALALATRASLPATGVSALDTILGPVFVVLVSVGFVRVARSGTYGCAIVVASAAASALIGFALRADGPTALGLVGTGIAFGLTVLAGETTPFGSSIVAGAAGALTALSVLLCSSHVDPATGTAISLAVVWVPLCAQALRVARRRWVQRIPDGRAAHLLVLAAQAITGAIAARVAQGRLPAVVLVAFFVAIYVALLLTGPARRRHKPERQWRAMTTRGLLVAAGAMVLCAAPAFVTLLKSTKTIRDSSAEFRRLSAQSVNADANARTGQLEALAARLGKVSGDLRKGPVRIGEYVPYFGPNLRATRVATSSAARVASAVAALSAEVAAEPIGMSNGVVTLTSLGRVQAALRLAGDEAHAAATNVGADGQGFLLPPVRNALEVVHSATSSASRRLRVAATGAEVASVLVGRDTPQTFFLAVENNAEARATGGVITNWGLLRSDKGAVKLEDFRREDDLDNLRLALPRYLRGPQDYVRRYSQFAVARDWHNINLTPDFPTAASVIADQYGQASRNHVDGVISIDPVGLASLLRLTGPVSVAAWPEPITADNVVRITLRDEYEEFAGNPTESQRERFLGDIAAEVWRRVSTGGFGSADQLSRTLARAVTAGHLKMWTSAKGPQAFFDAVGASGRVRTDASDVVLVTTQNASGNKVDYYLHRKLDYRMRVLEQGAASATVRSTLRVTLRNDAPSSGLARYALGPYDERFHAGENMTYFTAYSPLILRAATVGGAPLEMQVAPELGRYAYSAFVSIPPGQSRVVELTLAGSVPLDHGELVLDVVRQPVLNADRVAVSVREDGRATELFRGPLWRTRRLRMSL